jgi:hypothetical protein
MPELLAESFIVRAFTRFARGEPGAWIGLAASSGRTTPHTLSSSIRTEQIDKTVPSESSASFPAAHTEIPTVDRSSRRRDFAEPLCQPVQLGPLLLPLVV